VEGRRGAEGEGWDAKQERKEQEKRWDEGVEVGRGGAECMKEEGEGRVM